MISNDILGINNPFYRLMPESVSNIVLPASSPSTLRSAYDRGSMAGVIVDAPEAPWYVRQAARYDFDALADLREEPLLFEESVVYRDIAGKHKDRPRVLQWHDYLRMSPKAMSGAQKTGDCVSWAIRCVREILRTLRIGKGVWEAFIERQATCGIYSGRGHTGQGASPARLTAYAITIGTLLEKVYKTASKTYDFREYSDYVRWGMSRGRVGMPDDLLEHTRHATDDRWYVVRDPEAVADAMAADFVVHCGSSIGVSSSGDFVSSLRGSWSHDMALCGYDISQEFTRDKIFAWDQSWGNWNRLTNVPSAYQPLGQGMFFLTWNSSQRGFSRGGTCVIVPGSYFEAEVDIRAMIDQARVRTAQAVNSALVELYWQIGKRIREDVLQDDRAEYGQEIVQTLSAQLTAEYGRGFGRSNLFQMVRFVEVFDNERIVQTLSGQLSWSHFVQLIPLDDPLKREFYAEMCRVERWSVRTLRHKIGHLLYERTAVAKKPEQLIEQDLAALRDKDRMSPDLVFRDPYFLDFLGLTGQYTEKDVERAILRELEAFILELGTDFAFIARQKRMTVDDEDYYLDLLFFHRRLRRLVAIDLKLGKFQAADKGQMELYLRWLEEYEMQPGEEPPLGLILCAGKTEGHVRLLRLGESGIHAAQYLTELPPREVLERKLHDAVLLAREHLAEQPTEQSLPARLPTPPKKKSQRRSTKDKRS